MYERYGKKLLQYAINTWNLNEDDAWNLIYQTLYKVIDNIEKYQFENEEKFASFVFRVFINLLRNHHKYTNKQKEQIEFVNYNESLSESNYESKEFNSDVQIARKVGAKAIETESQEAENTAITNLKTELDKLEEWERMLLLLKAQNLPYSEIAKYINKPEGNLKVYYQRLKNKLMEKLNNTDKI
ncbi:MAG: sigma-70 family RNA polymerase sigma factor [Bacteroidetes bacterium]|nr:sigma-70 family RNA polymerase sigma factor [Bacteroidota bacterium]